MQRRQEIFEIFKNGNAGKQHPVHIALDSLLIYFLIHTKTCTVVAGLKFNRLGTKNIAVYPM